MIDPRAAGISRKLSNVQKILIFASAKGGVGKSLLASVSALLFASQGYRTGLLDLDFHGASDHILLDIPLSLPQESEGILPLKGPFDLGFMSIAAFTRERSVPLRGSDVASTLLELLCVTHWGERDYLVVDMPPGIGDQTLDVLRYLKGGQILVVSTSSLLSIRVVRRLLSLLDELKMPVYGIIANMVEDERPQGVMRELSDAFSVPFLGAVPAIQAVESDIGSPEKLVSGMLAERLDAILSGLRK